MEELKTSNIATRSSGLVALVTGASRGLGRALVARMVGTGYRVVGLARSTNDLATLTEGFEHEQFRAVTLDLTQPDAPAAAVRATVDTFGGLDVVVNNAGGSDSGGLDQLTREDWDRLLALNVTAPLFLCQEAMPWLRRSRAADIVMINSRMALQPSEKFSPYGAAKIFLAALTSGLQRQMAALGIRLTTIYPGGLRTHFGGIPPDDTPTWWLEPEEVADVILHALEAPRRVWIKQIWVEPFPSQMEEMRNA